MPRASRSTAGPRSSNFLIEDVRRATGAPSKRSPCTRFTRTRLPASGVKVAGSIQNSCAVAEPVSEVKAAIEELLRGLGAHNHETAVVIAGLPERMRGFGHVKIRNVEETRTRQQALMERFQRPPARDAA